VNEVPNRAIIDLEAAPSEFDNKPAQGEVQSGSPMRRRSHVAGTVNLWPWLALAYQNG